MKIGHIEIDKALLLAPMEKVTDMSFRIMCKRMGADIVYTEFSSSEAIIRDAKKAYRKMEIHEDERPIGIQIYGGVESSMEDAARRVEALKPDIIDINCGCWVKNHAARGEGAGLLKDLKQFEKIVKATVRGTKIPVTVKTRLGWDENSIVIMDVAQMVEQAGAQALTVHCRTRKQGHCGEADWEWLSKIKKTISIPLIGNGDVKSFRDVRDMFETGCDGVMIARGAISNFWIFEQSKYFLQTGKVPSEPTLKERIDKCIEHLNLSVEYRGPVYGIQTFRKYYSGYLYGLPGVSKLRAELMVLKEKDQIIDKLISYLNAAGKFALSV